jgi:hypothetical protein
MKRWGGKATKEMVEITLAFCMLIFLDFAGFSTVHSVCLNTASGAIEHEEFICLMYIWNHANRDDKLRWIFNLFDMDADEKLCKKEFKKIELALIQVRGTMVHPHRSSMIEKFLAHQSTVSLIFHLRLLFIGLSWLTCGALQLFFLRAINLRNPKNMLR